MQLLYLAFFPCGEGGEGGRGGENVRGITVIKKNHLFTNLVTGCMSILEIQETAYGAVVTYK